MGSAMRVITCSTGTRRRRTCLGFRSTAPFESAETWTILSHSTVYRRHSSICCAGCTAKRGTCFFRCFSQSTSASSSCSSSSSSSLRLPFCDHELDITYHSPSHLAELPCLCLHERPRWTAIVCCGSRAQTMAAIILLSTENTKQHSSPPKVKNKGLSHAHRTQQALKGISVARPNRVLTDTPLTENTKDILCRNVTIYGKCRYEDKGTQPRDMDCAELIHTYRVRVQPQGGQANLHGRSVYREVGRF